MIKVMEYWLDKIKVTIQMVIVFILAFLTPMKNAIDVLLIVAVADFFAGMSGNVWTGEERFRIGKAFGSMYKIMAYLVLVILAHFAADNLGYHEFSSLLVNYITLLVVYWYFVNILSNLVKAFPSSSGLAFLYLLISFKILPLILEKIGIGGEDVQELADKARAMANGGGETETNKEKGGDENGKL